MIRRIKSGVGRTMITTPAKPTPIALQRRQPTDSCSSSAASAVAITGPANAMAMASAMGIRERAVANRNVETVISVPRVN